MLTLTFEEVYIKLSPFILFRMLVLLPMKKYKKARETVAEKEHRTK